MTKLDGSRVHARGAWRLLDSLATVLALVLGGVSAASGEIFVTNLYTNSVTVYARTASGGDAPLRTIVGVDTGLYFPSGIAVDTIHDEIFVANRSDEVTVYSRTADGNIAPLRTISGGSTLLNQPRGLALDTVNDELWVANSGNNSITVYSRKDIGDMAPKRRIKGNVTGLNVVEGLAVDAFNGEVAITNLGNHSIVVHSRTAVDNSAPLRTIAGIATLLGYPAGVFVDLAHNELIVGSGNSLLTFDRTASGDVAPLRSITGALTELSGVGGVSLDPIADQVIVVNQNANSLGIFARTAQGDVAPVGGTTGLHFPQYVALAPDGSAVPAALAVDPAGNGVLEPGESAVVSPSWTNTSSSLLPLLGVANSFTGPAGAAYTINDGTANYATISPGTAGDCASSGGDCYVLGVSNPSVRPGLHWDAAFSESVSSGSTKTWTIHVGNSFMDVPSSANIYPFVETILHNGLTAGCGTGNFCPVPDVTRGQIAVFLLRARYGSSYVPSDCTTPDFGDVPCSNPFSKWINDLYQRGVTGGCGPALFCPNAPVTRAQVAVFLLRTLEGTSYVAPPCVTPTFGDVPCSSGFAKWVDELALRGIVVGCGGGNYCPDLAVTRGQMAVFLTATFGLKLYGL